jgi:hypothetical protein
VVYFAMSTKLPCQKSTSPRLHAYLVRQAATLEVPYTGE